jgi:hypothetical protein
VEKKKKKVYFEEDFSSSPLERESNESKLIQYLDKQKQKHKYEKFPFWQIVEDMLENDTVAVHINIKVNQMKRVIEIKA